jgi:hypothetical protein
MHHETTDAFSLLELHTTSLTASASGFGGRIMDGLG